MGEGIGNGAHHRRLRGGRKTHYGSPLQRYEEQGAHAAAMPCDTGRRIRLHPVYVGEGHGHLRNDTRTCMLRAHRRQPRTRIYRCGRRSGKHPHGRLEEDNRKMVNGIQRLQHDKELRLQRRGRTAHVMEQDGNMGGESQRYGLSHGFTHKHRLRSDFADGLSLCRQDIHPAVQRHQFRTHTTARQHDPCGSVSRRKGSHGDQQRQHNDSRRRDYHKPHSDLPGKECEGQLTARDIPFYAEIRRHRQSDAQRRTHPIGVPHAGRRERHPCPRAALCRRRSVGGRSEARKELQGHGIHRAYPHGRSASARRHRHRGTEDNRHGGQFPREEQAGRDHHGNHCRRAAHGRHTRNDEQRRGLRESTGRTHGSVQRQGSAEHPVRSRSEQRNDGALVLRQPRQPSLQSRSRRT